LDKTIVTALLVMAGVISAVFVFNSIFPVIQQSGDAIVNMQGRYDSRLKTQIEIVHATRSGGQVEIWAKNIGSLPIKPLESCDLFFGPEGNFMRIPFGVGSPHWEYAFENDTAWNPTATVHISILDFSPLDSGRYLLKLITPNGVSTDYFFSW
jgi:hypothetical protein